MVKNKNGDTFQVPKDDKRYLNGELVHITKNTVTVKDKNNNTFQVPKDDERYLNDELESIEYNEESKRKIGKKPSNHQKGSRNSQYETC